MPEIKPFRATSYDPEKAGRYEDLVAPPYDVISKEVQEDLYKKSDYNVIRLILGKKFPTDNEKENRYTRARECLENWMEKGILKKDQDEGIYVYAQDYEHEGVQLERVGFICLVKIDDSPEQNIMPHERTLSKPKEDRLDLIKQTRANLSPIFSVFDDSSTLVLEKIKSIIKDKEPSVDISLKKERDRLWHLTDQALVNDVARKIRDKKVFIADGHHRYEVAKTYRDLMRNDNNYKNEAEYVMMYLTDLSKPENLTVMATHRVIRTDAEWKDLMRKSHLNEFFDMTECTGLEELMKELESSPKGEHAFGSYAEGRYIFLKPKDNSRLKELVPNDKTGACKDLDVSVLHSSVIEKMIEHGNVTGDITYLREPSKAVDFVDGKTHRVAFFLKPTPVEQMRSVAEAGEMMPQKSTYFHPKLYTGLVFNKF